MYLDLGIVRVLNYVLPNFLDASDVELHLVVVVCDDLLEGLDLHVQNDLRVVCADVCVDDVQPQLKLPQQALELILPAFKVLGILNHERYVFAVELLGFLEDGLEESV